MFAIGTENRLRFMSPRRCCFVLVSFSLLFAACRERKVTAYRVPKDQEPPPPMAAAAPSAPATSAPGMAATPVSTADGPGLTWTAPGHWQNKPGSAMRKGSYTVPGEGGAAADLSITAFPGDVGGEAANVNRWRGQLSLPPFSAGELATGVTRVAQNNLAFAVVDFAGPGANAQRLLGAIVPVGDATWFFKLMGPDALVAKEKPAFLEFLKTVKAPASAPR